MTDQEELDQVNAAISAIYARGQSMSIRENSVQKGDLDTLLKRKDQLTARINRTARGGIIVRGVTPV